MINPMSSLPGFGAILLKNFNFNTDSQERTNGDLYAAVLDYLVGMGWKKIGLFPQEEIKHRKGVSILELQSFIDWAMMHLIQDMEMDVDKLDKEFAAAVKVFMEGAEK